jgi:regulatory protein
LLSVRSRSRAELRRRLTQAAFEPAEVEDVLEDLERVGLVDDDRFAREFVRDRAALRLTGGRAIRAELLRLGVRAELADAALAEAGDETERARTLALKRAPRLRALPPEAAYRRLYSLLLRRGYGHRTASAACAEALGGLTAE